MMAVRKAVSAAFLSHLFGSLEIKQYLCGQFVKDRLMTEENTIEIEILGDENGLLAAEGPVRDIFSLLEDLRIERGANFIKTLKEIAKHPSFFPVKGEANTYSTGGEGGDDFDNLLNAARKAVEHGYRVFILPNPKEFRTADFIFERRGIYKLFDLKTISGKSIVETRLMESIGQTNRVLLNMTVDYNPALLARNIKRYFERSNEAMEVLIFKGKKIVSVDRDLTLSSDYYSIFMKRYVK